MIDITLPDGTIKVLVEGLERAKLQSLNQNKDCLFASIKFIEKKIKS